MTDPDRGEVTVGGVRSDELRWGAGVYWATALTGVGSAKARAWGVCHARTGRGRSRPLAAQAARRRCGDACRSTRDNRNPSTAGAPASPCCSAGTASAYRSFGGPGNHHIWRRDRSTGRAAMRGGCGRRSDQSVTRSAVRSGRTPARTSSS